MDQFLWYLAEVFKRL